MYTLGCLFANHGVLLYACSFRLHRRCLVQMLLHLLLFDVKTMHYILQSTALALPNRGYVRHYTRCQFSPDFHYLYATTSVGDVTVFSVVNSIFRAGLNVRPVSCFSLFCAVALC
jgi:hypothetical protein